MNMKIYILIIALMSAQMINASSASSSSSSSAAKKRTGSESGQEEASAAKKQKTFTQFSSNKIHDELINIVSKHWRYYKQIKTLHGGPHTINSVALSEDKQMIVAGSADRTIKIWQRDHQGIWQAIASLAGHKNGVYSVAISQDKKMIVSGSQDKTIKIWTADQNGNWHNQCAPHTTLIGHEDGVVSVAISPDKQMIVSGSNDETIKIWTTDQNGNWNAPSATLAGHENTVTAVAISPDKQIIVSGSKDKTIKIWTADQGNWHNQNVSRVTLTGQNDFLNFVAISPDKHMIISSSRDNIINIWATDQGGNWHNQIQPIYSYVGIRTERTNPMALSLDTTMIVAGSDAGGVSIWQLMAPEDIQDFLAQPLTLAQYSALALLTLQKEKTAASKISLRNIAIANNHPELLSILRHALMSFPKKIRQALIAHYRITDLKPTEQEIAHEIEANAKRTAQSMGREKLFEKVEGMKKQNK